MFLKELRSALFLLLCASISPAYSTDDFTADVPDSWDIRGLKIGMTLVEAQTAITNALGIEKERLKVEPAFVESGSQRLDYKVSITGYYDNETLAAHFTAPPGKERVIAIAREKTYPYGSESNPSLHNLVAALGEKYGEPHFVNNHFPHKPMLVWQSGKEKANNRNVCVRFIHIKAGPLPHHWNLGQSRPTYDKADTCDYGMRADISATPDGFVQSLKLTLVDKASIKASGAQTKAMKELADAALHRDKERKADSVVPEL